jgi:hypothetical protein
MRSGLHCAHKAFGFFRRSTWAASEAVKRELKRIGG